MFPYQGAGTVSASPKKIYACDGDSISDAATEYAALFALRAQIPLFNFAVPAATLADALARAPTVDQIVPCNITAPGFVFSAMIGGNGFASAGTQALLDQIESLRAYYAARKAAGYRVIGITWLPRTTPGFNAARAQVNIAIRTWVGLYIDAIADFAADPTVGTDAAGADTALYPDGIHPTAAVHLNYLLPIFTTAAGAVGL